ncbi:2-hydroxyacid dehydrogenase [Agrobacterium vitis]|uniref:2-hydroxyacid dehydrogenase n=1 Tax=Agrobacterium vitis TaxID=373 RepID=A0ABD6GE44_AGRVI|nr:2-hydroxyacid dehydrogenase [Agrobacterium vitis]MUO78906.1 2-hydroxyacid dehydrogenase [Agrobacterium vitis]MUO94469.1 2-hydroxyacid dehydrogenase [Agrobacterium vitis]MUP06128.1 2-hydroxyacid dehydrogenase [Agrobacterium vitis]MUZ82225.1 2-hydroxyacid dehydrogenase [Agrobacterium vitis]MVA11414.1 2-hydroxyacid dehydrogenase [Agrobacterium vitis]
MLSITLPVKFFRRVRQWEDEKVAKPEILQVGPYPAWDEKPLNAQFSVHRYFEAHDKAAFLTTVGPSICGIATRGELGADRAMIDACPKLEIISVYGVGYDAVDLEACRARGIRVTNTPDVLTNDVADLGVAMMLCQSRGMIGAETWVKDGSWAAKGLYPLKRRVWGRRAGVLGLGRIGFEVAKRLKGFDMQISYSDVAAKPYAEGMTFVADPVELARTSDFLFVTLAASADTRHIVGRDVIEALGPEGMLINISRATNIDEAALLDALETGRLGAAALDVFEGEPRLDPRFLALDNVLLQPHHASGTIETRQAMGQLVRDNLIAHFAGSALPTPVL